MISILKLFNRRRKIQKRSDFAQMSLRYTDSEGRKYYSYDHDLSIPIHRGVEIQKVLMEIGAGMAKDELEAAHKFIEDNIDHVINTGKLADLANSKFILKELRKTRKEIVVHEYLYFKLVSLTLIREDEDPSVIDNEIIDVKINVFKKESQGKRYVFFYGAGLSKYIPYFEKLKEGWTEYCSKTEKRSRAVKEMLDLISSGQELSTSSQARSVN